ncbi:MAG: putative heme-binding domain-containing protein [Verrucomicrobiales bacterium]|jgi:putative heme-binding domain-containing protein
MWSGKKLFHDKAKLNCTLCHQIYGREINKPAPNLFGVGDKFTPAELIRTIEKPSESVLPGFETTQITTTAGETHVGILRSVSAKSGYELVDLASKTHRILQTEVASRDYLPFSLMPESLTAGLSQEDYADLIAYLLDQKTTGLAGLKGKEEAADVVILKKPITLTPYHSPAIEFFAPVFFTLLPGEENQFVILEHEAGKVWRLIKSTDGERKELFLGISQERRLAADGLVGIAFHPLYTENRKYYIKCGLSESEQLKTIIEEREADASGLRDSGPPPTFDRSASASDQPQRRPHSLWS